ncbi:MAG: stage II sporulation protein P [Clostridia bacterium]
MTANVSPIEKSAEEAPQSSEPETELPAPEQPVVFERTITTAPLSSDGLYISNLAKAEFDINELLSLPPETAGAEVLILHTHGCEAYTPTKENNYAPTSDFRTTDTNYNVVRVGDEIAKALESFGIKVIHDTTLCDYPSYTESYNNSLALAKKYTAENPDIKVILDIHRDSISGENGEQIKTVGAPDTAQLMFVVGTDTAGLEHPLWRQNLSFALNLQKRIIGKYPDMMRPINLRDHRFNQQVSTGSLIVEVGSDGNTLEEALNAARIFGRELGGYLTGTETSAQ